jgi:hypothetical protein
MEGRQSKVLKIPIYKKAATQITPNSLKGQGK